VIDLVLACIVVLVLDQWTKSHARTRALPVSASRSLIRVRSRQARRVFTSNARMLLAAVWVFSFISSVTLHVSGAAFQSRASAASLGVALGGAAGNLRDVLRLSSVTDFLEIGWWPSFNLADVAIIAGLIAAFTLR
jgi:lipoprotein signal peptidase